MRNAQPAAAAPAGATAFRGSFRPFAETLPAQPRAPHTAPSRLARSHRAAAAVVCLCAVVPGCGRDAGATDGGDLSARCERAVDRATAAAVAPLPWSYTAGTTMGDETHPLGQLVGAAWDDAQHRLYVLDAYNRRVVIFGERGEYVGSFGRQGQGPGEFDELGSSHGSRHVYNQLAVAGKYVVVNDLGLLHVFDAGGRFVGRIFTNGVQAGPHGIRHLAAISDSGVLFAETGAMRLETDDRDVRTGARLLRASVRGQAIDTVSWGQIRNPLSRLPRFEGMPPRDPYGPYTRRTWDAIPSGVLAIPSQYQHGVCFFDRGTRLVSAFRVDAPPIAVDHAERNRIMRELRERHGATVPIIGGKWDDFYAVWPKAAPPYLDVALTGDSIAWVERFLPGHDRMVDLFHARRGYLGSMKPLGENLPITFAAGCALVIEERIPEEVRGANYFYGLRRWCRTPRLASAATLARSSP